MYFKELVQCCEAAGQMEEANKFRECSEIASEICHNANDMMTAGRIDEFPGDITKQVTLWSKDFPLKLKLKGELLHRGSVYCKVPSMDRRSLFSKGKPTARLEHAHVFLFQQSVVICYYRIR